MVDDAASWMPDEVVDDDLPQVLVDILRCS